MEHEVSLPCSSKYTVGPYDSLNPLYDFYTSSKFQFNIILPSRRWPLKPLNVFRQEIVYIFPFLPSARSAGLPSCNEIIECEVLH